MKIENSTQNTSFGQLVPTKPLLKSAMGIHTYSEGRELYLSTSQKFPGHEGYYKKAVIKDNVLTGFIAQGDISYVGVYTQLIKDKIKVENLKERVFDLGYSDFFKIKEDGQFEW